MVDTMEKLAQTAEELALTEAIESYNLEVKRMMALEGLNAEIINGDEAFQSAKKAVEGALENAVKVNPNSYTMLLAHLKDLTQNNGGVEELQIIGEEFNNKFADLEKAYGLLG